MKKNSDTKVMLKEAMILFAITLVAGLILGFVHELTKGAIKEQQEKAVTEACRKVFSQADSFTETNYVPSADLSQSITENGVKIGTVFSANAADGTVLGYVVETISTRGYGGDIVLYTGITDTLLVQDVSILKIQETPGLGMQAEKVLVPQFHNKQVETFTYTKSGSRADSEIDAISGATITTKAVTNAVNAALDVAKELTGGVR